MSQPSVTITELDGALGVLPPTSGALLAFVGTASSGPLDTPASFARVKDLVSSFSDGPTVEAAAHYIERYGRPVLFVRTGNSVAGDEGTLDDAAVAGTSVITLDTAPPNDDYEIVWRAIAGGTIGVAGITFQWSLDGGRTLSPVTALGTANNFVFPGTGGVNIDFAAGTIVAGDEVTTRTVAPNWNSTELGTALDALIASAATWKIAEIVGPIDGTAYDLIATKMAGAFTAGKPRAWIGNTRMPDVGESEATYLAAMDTIFSAKSTVYGGVCSGSCKLISSVSGRQYKRPVSFPVGAFQGFVDDEVNIADVNLGALTGVSIRDANGNADEHDESLNPGLDDARFTVLRTHSGTQGVYVNRPRIHSASGSDFELFPHRLVMNLGHIALRTYFQRRLNKPVLVNATTGFILESEAREIERGATSVLRSLLLAKPKASGVSFVLSRTDNLLSTKRLNGQARIVPLAYPEFITLDIGFENPALIVQAA